MQSADAADRRVLPQPEQLLGHLLNRLALLARERTYSALEGLHLAPRSLGILLCLADQPGASQRALGRRLGLDRTTVGQLVEQLENDGWICRETDPADRRNFQLRLTQTGLEGLGQASATTQAVQDQILNALPAKRARQLVEDLNVILQASRKPSDD